MPQGFRASRYIDTNSTLYEVHGKKFHAAKLRAMNAMTYY